MNRPARPERAQDSTAPQRLGWLAFAALAAALALLATSSRAERAVDRRVAVTSEPSAPTSSRQSDAADAACPALFRHTFNVLQTGRPQSLCQYRGKVVLIVNTASFCGYTHQYEGLEALYRKYRDRGLVVLGFPSNDYGAQEPGSNKEIAEFCRTTYGIQFPMFEKANGTRLAAHPLFVELAARTGQAPRWNFHKYLIDPSGNRVESFQSAVEPGQRTFVAALERMLAALPPP